MALLTREMLDIQAGREPATLEILPEDSPGATRRTLGKMVALTKEYKFDPAIRALAEAIVSAVPAKNVWAEVTAVRDWVANNIRYTGDIGDVEHIKTPVALLMDRYGDCDDMALLTGTLLKSIGYAVKYIATGATFPDEFDHVFTATRIGNRWVNIETTADVPLGWQGAAMAYMEAHV